MVSDVWKNQPESSLFFQLLGCVQRAPEQLKFSVINSNSFPFQLLNYVCVLYESTKVMGGTKKHWRITGKAAVSGVADFSWKPN